VISEMSPSAGDALRQVVDGLRRETLSLEIRNGPLRRGYALGGIDDIDELVSGVGWSVPFKSDTLIRRWVNGWKREQDVMP